MAPRKGHVNAGPDDAKGSRWPRKNPVLTTLARHSELGAEPHSRSMQPRAHRVLLIGSLTALVISRAEEQEQRFNAERPRCASCRVRITPVATLHRDSDGDTLGGISAVARSGSNIYYSHSKDLGHLHVFHLPTRASTRLAVRSDGERVTPGMVASIAILDDGTLTLADPLSRRIFVYSASDSSLTPKDLAFAPRRLTGLAPGRLLVNGLPRSPELVGTALHVAAVNGSVLKSFGGFGALFRSDVAFFGEYELAAAGGGTAWTSRKNSYVLELWDAEGNRRRGLRGIARWFPDWIGTERWPTDQVPKPRVAAIRFDAHGRLWVAIQLPRYDYLEHLISVPGERGSYRIVGDIGKAVQTEIQVIDVQRGELITRLRLDSYVETFGGDGMAIALSGNLVHGMSMQILEVELKADSAR